MLSGGRIFCSFVHLLHAFFFKGDAILVSENMFGPGQKTKTTFLLFFRYYIQICTCSLRGQVQVLMQICVCLHTCACARTHSGIGISEVCMYLLLLACLAWRPFCFLPFCLDASFFLYDDFPSL